MLTFLINRCELGDEEVEYILKADLDLTQKFGSGFVEDMFPRLAKYYPSQRWTEFVKETKSLLATFERLVKEHEETFDPSKPICYDICSPRAIRILWKELLIRIYQKDIMEHISSKTVQI